MFLLLIVCTSILIASGLISMVEAALFSVPRAQVHLAGQHLRAARYKQHVIKRQRIAKGSGTSVAEVNQLLRQFQQTQRLMRQVLQDQCRYYRIIIAI